MKFVIPIFVCLTLLLPRFAIAQDEAAEKKRVETDHLIIEFEPGAVSDVGLETMQVDGEKFYAAIYEMLGYEPPNKIVILMLGPAERPDGSWGYPHVDSWGRIHLYRFGPTHHSYFSALAHEMVHVFRIQRKPHNDWFLEEGFAEFVALRVDSSLAGFPWYDTPITIAAGQWVAIGEDIPLRTMRENHRELNQPCKAQTYSLRSAFFDYLGKAYGDDVVLKLADQERAGELADYEKLFGKEFDAMVMEWREHLLAEYNQIEDVENLARRYREESPIQYMPVCREGEDF